MVVMMYDTSLRYQKLYQHLMKSWTQNVLDWSGNTMVLLGVPVYDDAGVEYHYPHVENLSNSLAGIHAGLKRYAALPVNYSGIALYSEWEMEMVCNSPRFFGGFRHVSGISETHKFGVCGHDCASKCPAKRSPKGPKNRGELHTWEMEPEEWNELTRDFLQRKGEDIEDEE